MKYLGIAQVEFYDDGSIRKLVFDAPLTPEDIATAWRRLNDAMQATVEAVPPDATVDQIVDIRPLAGYGGASGD